MAELDPDVPLALLAAHVPRDLHDNILVVGSLAAAREFRAQLKGRGVNTKDADVVVTPAGALSECTEIAQRLLDDGWRPVEGCVPSPTPDPPPGTRLEAIRLHPPRPTPTTSSSSGCRGSARWSRSCGRHASCARAGSVSRVTDS